MESHQSPAVNFDAEGFVRVGVVAAAHGHDGSFRVRPDSDNPERFRPGGDVWIGGAQHRIERASVASAAVLLKLAEIDTPEAAAQLLHEPIHVPSSSVPSLPEDTYYHYQLIGMQVTDDSGNNLGVLTEVLETGANDVYVVTGEGRELLLPAIAEIVQAVDTNAGRMTVSLPEGLEWREVKATSTKPPRQRRRRRPQRKRPPDTGATDAKSG